jgi:branched-chain amino acid transport system substrate-binding protein
VRSIGKRAFRSPAVVGGRRSAMPGGRVFPVVVIVSALSIVGSACGARVGPYLGGGSSLSGNSATTTTTVASNTSGSQPTGGGTGGSSSGVRAQGGGGGASANPVVAPPSQFDYSPATEAGACKGTTGNTASAPGISANAIQIGNVSGLSGPLSGSFPQGPQALTALFDAVNAAGGICGRQLSLNVQDDGQNSTTNASDVQSLINKPVFAFAGSTSDADNGGVPAMQQGSVPDFGFAINCVRSESSTYWSVAGGSCFQPAGNTGPYYIGDGYFLNAQQHGYLPKNMAFLAYSIAISAQAAQQFEYVYQHTFGGTPCYTDFSISPFNVNLEPDVAQMQANHCQGVIDTLDVIGNAQLLKALQQQNYSMPFVAATFDAYTPQLISTAGQSAAQGMLVTLPFVPLNESQHMDAMYKQQLAQYVPGAQPSGFGFLAWLAGQMMVYSLLQAGRNPTRTAVVNFLNGLQNYDAGGAVGPHAPSNHGANICTVDVTVQGNDFVRKSPPSGLFCGGQEVQASP